MPVSACPSCDKKLKTPEDAEGKKIRCPGCQTMLVITEDGLEEFEDAPVRTGVKKAGAGPSRKRAVDDDEDDEPRKKRRSRDDDDEDDDDAPKSKRRSRDDDDDDDDDRPRKKKKKRGIPMWVWLASGGGGLVVILLILFLFVFGGGSNFDKIKEGMTSKEVTDILGEPFEGDTKSTGVWLYPRIDKKDIKDMSDMSKLAKVKESLTVFFENGKVKKVVKADRNSPMGK